MTFEIFSIALIALFITFIIERIYRSVESNKRNVEMQSRKFMVLEDRLRKQSILIKQLNDFILENTTKKEREANYQNADTMLQKVERMKNEDMKRCPVCRKKYLNSLAQCPFCGN